MTTHYDPTYPIFVQNDDDRLRWKASLDICTVIYGLEFPRDVDLLQFVARSVFNSDVLTAELLGPQPEDRPE
jgi:hypothetical protein